MWLIATLAVFAVLSYHRATLTIWALSFALLLVFFTCLSHASPVAITLAWLTYLIIFTPLLILPLRRKGISSYLLAFYRKVMPSMSRTEQEALAAGTVSWEGDLFRGAPNWKHFLKLPSAKLSAEELAFINGPLETLCGMIDDWDITHNLADLPADVWKFIREQGFFGLIIPKKFGGREFSAYAHSQILTKIYGRSSSTASTVAVPNSLGPAELLLHYGTEEQKNYYLPRLAKGEEVPCFALTGPEAGSDAGAMQDYGIVCWGEHDGKKTLGIRLNFDKRYITLAPVATVVGLAFKLYDPDHLLGTTEDIGITCALIPRDTPNMEIGRRHFPCNIVFQNGPIRGKDVFIPVDYIIGGAPMAGQGWRMLMECLAAGRAISLPSSSCGGTKALTYATGAYCRIRKQFNVSIGKFEGIEEALGRIGGLTYMVDAARTFAAAAIDAGHKPAIASAIIKLHTTEFGRVVANDAMDIHGGKGICLGPKNYIGRGYQSVPIAITVEGANILTRNMIIFGQGAMRCHPYIFSELTAAKIADPEKSLVAFDKAIFGHIGFTISNIVRSLLLSLTSGYIASAPSGKLRRYYQQTTRFSASFALIADMSLLLLGGSLKRKENISARLGDILSNLYLVSAVLKHYTDQGSHEKDLPLVRWSVQYCFYQIQEKLVELFNNYPNRIAGAILQLLIFPLGRNFRRPSDKLTRKVADLLQSPSPTRDRLTQGVYLAQTANNPMASLQDALLKTIATEGLEKTVRDAIKNKVIVGHTTTEQIQAAYHGKLITQEEYQQLIAALEARKLVIAVDDFSTEELARVTKPVVKNQKDRSRDSLDL